MIVVEFFGIRIFSKIIDVPREILYGRAGYLHCGRLCQQPHYVRCVAAVCVRRTGFLNGEVQDSTRCFVLGLVLGENIETNLRRAIQLGHGSFEEFFTRPISCVLLIISFVIIARTIYVQVRSSRATKQAAPKE